MRGALLGVFPGQEYETATHQLNPGDKLMLYSDGIPDAMNEAEEFYSEERLLAEKAAESPDEAVGEQAPGVVGRRGKHAAALPALHGADAAGEGTTHADTVHAGDEPDEEGGEGGVDLRHRGNAELRWRAAGA